MSTSTLAGWPAPSGFHYWIIPTEVDPRFAVNIKDGVVERDEVKR